MNTNTNTDQTRQTSTTNTSSNDESNCDNDHNPDNEHIELDLSPETTPFGSVHCPREGCDRNVPTARGLPSHYGQSHTDASLIIDLVGKDTWLAYLRQEHVEREDRRTARDIADDIPYFIKSEAVMADLKRFDIYEPFPESNVPARDILAHTDVTTIEEAQAMSRKLREEGGA